MKERTWILSLCSGDQLCVLVKGTPYFLETLVDLFLRQTATMRENPIKWIRDSRVFAAGLSLGLQVAMTTCWNPVLRKIGIPG